MDTYRVTHVYEKANAAATEVDVFQTWDQCDKDDTYDFSGGGVYIVTDAGYLCSPSNFFTGTWALSGSNITVNGVTYAISGYSCSGMTLTTNNATTGGSQRIVMVR
ncbi:MAG: lipocalin family protein [Bacteroidetes bacterium]|nr:lipocalin family protein [Bacteroidota bacterium]